MPELFGLRINQKIKRQDTAAEKKAAKASSSKSKKGKPKTTSPMQRMRSGTAHPSKKTSKLDKMPKGFGSRPVALILVEMAMTVGGAPSQARSEYDKLVVPYTRRGERSWN